MRKALLAIVALIGLAVLSSPAEARPSVSGWSLQVTVSGLTADHLIQKTGPLPQNANLVIICTFPNKLSSTVIAAVEPTAESHYYFGLYPNVAYKCISYVAIGHDTMVRVRWEAQT